MGIRHNDRDDFNNEGEEYEGEEYEAHECCGDVDRDQLNLAPWGVASPSLILIGAVGKIRESFLTNTLRRGISLHTRSLGFESLEGASPAL